MIAAFGDALGLLVTGDPALWDVIFRSLWVSTLAAVPLAEATAIAQPRGADARAVGNEAHPLDACEDRRL